MSSWFPWIVFRLCVYTPHSNAVFRNLRSAQVFPPIQPAYEKGKMNYWMQSMGTEEPLESGFNEKFQTRTVAVTQSIFCGSMIFYSIFRPDSMYNPPTKSKENNLSSE